MSTETERTTLASNVTFFVSPKLTRVGPEGKSFVTTTITSFSATEPGDTSFREDMTSILSIEDIIMMLPGKISDILTKNRADIADFEHALDILDNKRWGENIVVKRSIVNDIENVKILQINSEDIIRLFNKEINTIVMGRE